MEGFEAILVVGAALSFGLALLHVAMIPFGARAYRYFTAGDWMIEQSESGSPLPGLLTFGIAAVLASFGLYALAGAGVSISLPFIRAGVTVVAAIYLLRGFAFFPSARHAIGRLAKGRDQGASFQRSLARNWDCVCGRDCAWLEGLRLKGAA